MQQVDVTVVDNAGSLHAQYMWQNQTVTTQIDEDEAKRMLGITSPTTYPIQLHAQLVALSEGWGAARGETTTPL